jgi:hypothetical protein
MVCSSSESAEKGSKKTGRIFRLASGPAGVNIVVLGILKSGEEAATGSGSLLCFVSKFFS